MSLEVLLPDLDMHEVATKLTQSGDSALTDKKCELEQPLVVNVNELFVLDQVGFATLGDSPQELLQFFSQLVCPMNHEVDGSTILSLASFFYFLDYLVGLF